MTTNTVVLSYPKSTYPESVIRKALYWLSQFGEWTLREDETCWLVEVSNGSSKIQSQLDRLLNDQLLRYTIDEKTGYLRQAIIKKVLTDIEAG